MDVEVVEKLQSQPFSPARRIFILEDMRTRLTDDSDDELRQRIRRIIELDRDNVRRDTEARRPGLGKRQLSEVIGTIESNEEARTRTHREFVALVVYILRTHCRSARQSLLAPVRRQTDRIHRLGTRHRPRSTFTEEQTTTSGSVRPTST